MYALRIENTSESTILALMKQLKQLQRSPEKFLKLNSTLSRVFLFYNPAIVVLGEVILRICDILNYLM